MRSAMTHISSAALIVAALCMLVAPRLGPALARDAIAPPKVSATSVYVLNADTGEPLYRKSETKLVISLSLTKLVTAEVLMQRLGDRLSESVTITPAFIAKGSSAGLRKGDLWSLTALLYGLLLV